jgi:hypothetical protein
MFNQIFLPRFNDCIYEPLASDLLHESILTAYNPDNLRKNDLLVDLLYYKLDYNKIAEDFAKKYIEGFNRWIKQNYGFNCHLQIEKVEMSTSKKIVVYLNEGKIKNVKRLKKMAEKFVTECIFDMLQELADKYNSNCTVSDLELFYIQTDITAIATKNFKKKKNTIKFRKVLEFVNNLK